MDLLWVIVLHYRSPSIQYTKYEYTLSCTWSTSELPGHTCKWKRGNL